MDKPTKSTWTAWIWRIAVSLGTFTIAILSNAVQSNADEARDVSTRKPWTTSRIQGAPYPPAEYQIVPAFPQLRFDKPTSLEEIPGSNRLLVTEMTGRVLSFPIDLETAAADLVLDLRNRASDQPNQVISLFDAELHPRYRENGYLFLCYVHPGDGGHTRVSRFTVSNDGFPRSRLDSEQVIIRWPAGGHNAGCLEFGTDGYLYIATGDGSGPNPPDALTTGQDITDLLGSILRIDVDRREKDRAYAIPSDNPFVRHAGARPEIWAYGLRNPWKIGVDRVDGSIYAADNGWETWEMVHRIVRGGNCGWPIMEGRAQLRTEVTPGPTPIIPPVKDHPHTEANSVIGGPVYRGNKLPRLTSSFIYGDYITGTIWAVTPHEDNSYSHQTLVDTDQRIIAFTNGSRGELYVLDYDFTGQIYELVPSEVEDTSASFPRRLSETGLFESLDEMRPAAGVVPYVVRAARWADGAQAQRWVAIPGAARVTLAGKIDRPATYPDGTVFVKHLTLPRGNVEPLRLETQILHFEHGEWRPYSYLWDEAGQDARLVESLGADRPLLIEDPRAADGLVQRTWHVSATNECRLCHNAGSGYVLGFSPHQLNRPTQQGFEQLSLLCSQGVLAELPAIEPHDPGRLVDPFDSSAELNDRARSYLHANCGMCHHPGGNAIVSFYLRRDLPFDRLNTNKGTGIGTFGMRDAKIIAPGDPYRSVLLYRMAKLGYARMPYIGSALVDSRGVALVEEWIRSLPASEGQPRSDPVIEHSAESTALRQLIGPSKLTQRQVQDALGQLLKTTEAALALVVQMHRGAVEEPVFRACVAAGRQVPSSDIRGLIETFVPESQRRARLGPSIDPESILSLAGNRDRGKLIFFSDTARCRGCHLRDDGDKSLGPTLTEIVKKYPRRSELLQQVLQPSLKIDEPYQTYSIITDDGQVHTGLILRRADDAIELKTAEQKIQRIELQAIEEIQKISTSLMPERLMSDLTAQEAADLIEYIMSP